MEGCVRLCQRYNFESKSQRNTIHCGVIKRCVRLCQRYNFESKSQQPERRNGQKRWCVRLCQRYNFESKSQPHPSSPCGNRGVSDYVKDTILKANHNVMVTCTGVASGVSDYVKDTILKANHNRRG